MVKKRKSKSTAESTQKPTTSTDPQYQETKVIKKIASLQLSDNPQVQEEQSQPPEKTAWGDPIQPLHARHSHFEPGEPHKEELQTNQPIMKDQSKKRSAKSKQKPGHSQPPEKTAWGNPNQPLPAGHSQPPQKTAWGNPNQPLPAGHSHSEPGEPYKEKLQTNQPIMKDQSTKWSSESKQKPGHSQPPQKTAWGNPNQHLPENLQTKQPTVIVQSGKMSAGAKPEPGVKSLEKPSAFQKPSEGEQSTLKKKDGPKIAIAEKICAPKKDGRPITVATNHYPLEINPGIVVYHYHVTITPDKPVKLLRSVWREFASKHFKNRLTCFDGKAKALSKGPLMDKPSLSSTVTVKNPDNNKDKDFNVTITKKREISFSAFCNYKQKALDNSKPKVLLQEELTTVEIILKNWSSDNFLHTKHVFFPNVSVKTPEMLSERLYLRHGFYQSAHLGYKPYLNFDVAFKPFYTSKNVIDIYNSMADRRGNVDFALAKSFFRTVMIEYELPNNPDSRRRFRVHELVDNALNQTFNLDGKQVTVADYFKTQRKINLKYANCPLLWVGPREKQIYIPMEFCKIVEHQIFNGALTADETRYMVKSCTTNASIRRENIQKCFTGADWKSNPYLKEFGLSVSDKMEEIKGRVLKPPSLCVPDEIHSWRDWKPGKFLSPVKLKKWCILNLDKFASNQDISNLEKTIKDRGRDLGIEQPSKHFIKCENVSDFVLRKTFDDLKDMDIVFVIISEAKGVYSKVKTICETQVGILTQCIKSKTLRQPPNKISTTIDNILLKVNAKLGGTNQSLGTQSILPSLKNYVMIIGADVTHPSPGSSLPCVAAVAVSYDLNAFSYNITLRVQKGEIIQDLYKIIQMHLSKFKEQRKKYPEKILFFRDGVSESQMEKVFNEELIAIQQACRNCGDPKITFLVVSKRHHTRFFATRREDEDKNFNVPAGTCIDTDIVHPTEMEFYLLSHSSIQGTARPTHYRVLYDDNKINDDELKKLTYYLCHLYSRCKRTVSYPTPTYYAHLGAFRGRAYLEQFQNRKITSSDLNKIQEMMGGAISKIYPMFFI